MQMSAVLEQCDEGRTMTGSMHMYPPLSSRICLIVGPDLSALASLDAVSLTVCLLSE